MNQTNLPDYYKILWETLGESREVQRRSTDISLRRMSHWGWRSGNRRQQCHEVTVLEVFVFAQEFEGEDTALRSDFIQFFLDHQALPNDERPFYGDASQVYNDFLKTL